jgi:hypothetical protein
MPNHAVSHDQTKTTMALSENKTTHCITYPGVSHYVPANPYKSLLLVG